ELRCNEADTLCQRARRALDQFAVPVTSIPGPENAIALIYERVVARDCENRFIDNHINPYELNHPTYGCTVASNLIQMVSDKRQFTSPALMEEPDGEKAVQAIRNYREPSDYTPTSVDSGFDSILQTIQETSGGGSR